MPKITVDLSFDELDEDDMVEYIQDQGYNVVRKFNMVNQMKYEAFIQKIEDITLEQIEAL